MLGRSAAQVCFVAFVAMAAGVRAVYPKGSVNGKCTEAEKGITACGTDADGNNVKYQCLYLGFWSVVKPCDKTCVTESPIQAYCT